MISYLRWNLKKKALVDLPCYTNTAVQDDFTMKIREILRKRKFSDEDLKILKILAPLTQNAQTDFRAGISKNCLANNVEIIKILAPLTVDPNALSYSCLLCDTVIKKESWRIHQIGRHNGKSNFTSIALYGAGTTPIHMAALMGCTEIVKILAPLAGSFNFLDCWGRTPIYLAALKGHTEIVKILAPLTDNPNAPIRNGASPMDVAKTEEIRKILASCISKNVHETSQKF